MQGSPTADLIEIEGCGHAPALMDDEQIGIVTGWLAHALRAVVEVKLSGSG